ncbi:MAG TPA: VIT domain-containing protein [Pirellulales bacterium]|jgi:outer membrane lipoprotein-sorting protein|nr:VIT domain-containing protein [Pirellulales bacterium]
MNDENSNPNANSLPDDEAQTKAMLRAIEADAPAADEQSLVELRQRTLSVFAAASKPATGFHSTPRAKRPNWLRRSLGLAAMAAAVVVGALLFTRNPVRGAPQFSQVLDDLRAAKTLELKVTKDGQSADVWIQAPGLVRWEDSPQKYRIASGSRLWQIDEANNTAVAGDSPWFLDPHKQIDLLGLLGLEVHDASPLLAARAQGLAEYADRHCYVYRVKLLAHDGPINIEAYVDAQLNKLLGITARPEGAPTVGPPLAELQLVAINGPVDDSKFVVAKTLTEDGRIGKIVDSQGLVVLRPMLAQRWTPISSETLLKTGDWLRTDIRGANAVKIRLSSEAELTLGPGSLLELISPTQARLHSGEVQYNAPKREGQKNNAFVFELLGPQKESQKLAAANKQIWRINRDEKLVEEKVRPQWLAGFEGASSNESLGSLIVNLPDHPNEPLDVGYHKVSVEIRDQIARTTIEESFVNHTTERLEGVFYFPLPQDASISDFGMWIGNALVEADIVEKQRAREIYETILREKRDPGLLEWTSGNLFKARVFPIEPMSEKRIKIVYTQVLPLRGNKYRYTYGLHSELLASHPLRELSLSVQVNSALPLKSVTCPTHSVRTEQTEHSAQVDFAAQEYTPQRDFEVVCEVESRNSDVVVVPHRRGDDGYFLLQLTPPGPEGNFQREVVADGKPLNLVLLCDTSASMDAEKRKQQSEFVATMLSSLGEKDRFQLAAADVATTWVSPEAMSPTAENIAQVREFLDKRVSLGWTDLDQAFAAVLKQAPTDAQVVYIGDGIVTAGETDPASFVKRLGRLIAGTPADGSSKPAQADEHAAKPQADTSTTSTQRSFHAVTVGNTYEAIVLRGIAEVGHGSVRNIGGERMPQLVALELLNELTQPSLRDVNVEFHGLQVAAVYPEHLPSLPAGTQQILVGRYLPTGADQQGEVVVTAKRGAETVRYAAKINLKDAEAGNSFIPRLWARQHLDHLLQQGPSEAIHNQIIALSEEFHIITPYTSLLVLESDADRERFGVKKRFTMRDGEQFFAAGRDNANFELLQKQMKQAGDWRLRLRYQVLRELAGLGRNGPLLQQQLQALMGDNRYITAGPIATGGVGLQLSAENNSYTRYLSISGGNLFYAGVPRSGLSSVNAQTDESAFEFNGIGGGGGGGGFGRRMNILKSSSDFGLLADGLETPLSDSSKADIPFYPMAGQQLEDDLEPGQKTFNGPLDAAEFDGKMETTPLAMGLPEVSKDELSEPGTPPLVYPDAAFWRKIPTGGRGFAYDRRRAGEGQLGDGEGLDLNSLFSPAVYEQKSRDVAYTIAKPVYEYGRMPYWHTEPPYTGWLNTLFPALAAPPVKPAPEKEPEGWSADAIALSKSLLRTDSLAKLTGGIEMVRTTDSFDPRWSRHIGQTSDLVLYSPTAWLMRSLDPSSHIIVNYCDEKERLVFSQALLLGRTRKSIERELKSLPMGWSDYSQTAAYAQFSGNSHAKVESAGENRAQLMITFEHSKEERKLLIDTARHVLLKDETFQDGKVTNTIEFSDFVDIGGSLLARRVLVSNAKGQKTSETKLEVNLLAPQAYSARVKTELAARPQVQFLQVPGVPLKTARQRVADGSASFDDRITMMLYNCLLQQWDELLSQLDATEKAATDKPGVHWLRTVILATIRRNEEARQRLLEEAHKLAAGKQPHQVFLADFVLDQAQSVCSPAELLEFVQILEPVYIEQPADIDLKSRWQERLLGCYESLDRQAEALALRRTLAEQAPWDVNRQIEYARKLLQAGQSPAAYDWVQKELDRPIEWTDGEDESLRAALAEFYRSEVRWEDLLHYTTEWIKRNPPYGRAYQEHLSALVYNNQLEAANALVEKWLKESQMEGPLPRDQLARLDVAISFAQGNCWNLQIDQGEELAERWGEPLAQVAMFFTQHKGHFDLVQRIVNDYRFAQCDACDRFRGFVLGLLQSDLEKLSPEQIGSFVSWALSGRIELPEALAGRKQLDASEIPDSVWKKIADALHERWLHMEDKDEKNSLSESLRTIYAARFDSAELLPFLRERIASAPKEFKPGYISALFDALLSHKWTEANEQEAFGWWHQLSTAEDDTARLGVQIPALYRLVDGMITARQAHDEQALHDEGKTDQLTRIELRDKKAEFAKASKAALSDRLAAEATKVENANKSDPHDLPLLPWLHMEQAYLDVQLNQNLSQVEDFCWKILGDAPPKLKEDSEAELADETADAVLAQLRRNLLDAMLRQRAFITAMNLAARRNAQPATIDRILKYIDAGIEQGGPRLAGWRAMKFQMLVALDRPDELEQQLRGWIRSDETTTPWRKALALLLAERGRLEEAIQLFEAAEKYKLLSGPDYRTLANWYLVNNRREDYDRCRIEAFKRMPEGVLTNSLWGINNRWQRRDLPPPAELDDDTLFAVRALLEKTSQPGNYFGVVRQLYESTRDFRLLEAIPDGAVGRSPEQIYPYLQNVQGQILSAVQKEAANDEIIARIQKLREGKLTTTDGRALDLLEAMVQRRSAEVLNQPGPHVDACVAALKRAFDRDWANGEPALMAGLLNSLGKLPQPAMVDEQLRELRELRGKAIVGSRDHLLITNHLSNLLFWSYDKHDEAIEQMQAEVRSYDLAHPHGWPAQDNDVLGDYVHLYEGARHFADGETVLQKYLATPENEQQRKWLDNRLFELYDNALDHDGEVSLGKGDELFHNLLAEGLKQLDHATDENVRHDTVARLCNTFAIAHQHHFADANKELRNFVFKVIPGVLPRQQSRYHDTANAPLGVIREALGLRAELRYLVERMEQYPAWLSIGYNNVWNAFGWELAQRREEAANTHVDIQELEPRILKLVIAELQRDLRSRQARNRTVYAINYSYFWAGKTDDFAQAAEEVYSASKNSGRSVQYIANYLWDGLRRFSRAIEMLLIAQHQGLLDEGMQEQLVDYLQQQNRHAESIAILEPLIEQHPDNMHYRCQLMAAYFHTQQPHQLAELVKQIDEHFHQGGRWQEGSIAELGRTCKDCQLYDQAVGYLNEAISLHQRANGGVTLNDQWLSDQYEALASAQAALGHTKEAVDAASGAIVCWGNRQDMRQNVLNTLHSVLSQSKDLPAYLKQLDEESAKSGQDSPILRKAIGQVFKDRKEYEPAIKQLQLAAQLQPNDREIDQALLECYDQLGKRAEATRQLLQLIANDQHHIDLYEKLADRLKDQPAEAERAVTSIVEVGSQEAENHTALATIREHQNRWDEAIAQWADVAKLRSLEPTGLVKLATAQIHQHEWAAAQQTIEKLQHTDWPQRFNDVGNQIRTLQEQLPKK